jgi:hypothetical protein
MLDATDLERIREIVKEEILKSKEEIQNSKEAPSTAKATKKEAKSEL